ncbi:hypothetical protein CPB84DRAFT_1803777 [Gymnopilus junonius]|uniref:Secreted protein n=1 Tax=Gymnopilus junonius TaxID=109634 RepID=A0A9P5N9A3_GYMJU|nr:hypothetical protein CPB84DRAFT_1803777 [Gymnopilus junonius]
MFCSFCLVCLSVCLSGGISWHSQCLRSWCLVVLPCKGPGDRVRLCLWQSPAQSTKPWALLVVDLPAWVSVGLRPR